jgi:hypothetical protein
MVELDLNAYNETLKRVTASDLASKKISNSFDSRSKVS